MNNWTPIVLGDFIDVLTDYHANGAYSKLKENIVLKYEEDYALMIRTLNFEANDFESKLIFLNKQEYNYLDKSKVYHNDIIMNKIANPGTVYLMPKLNKPVSLAMNLFLIRFKKTIDQVFIFHLMKMNENYIKRFANGTTTKSITKDAVRGLKFKVPDLSTQKQIAKVLSDLDAKIEINNKINQQLEAMAKTLYDYWFVQFDFPDKNGKPYKSSGGKMVFNEELKREIPEGWEVEKLINLCTRIGDGLHGTPKYVDNSDFSFINGNNLKNGFISTDNETKKVSAEEYEKHFIELNNNSILLSINGTLGNLAIYNNEKVMLGKSSAYINCKENHRTYCYEYLNQSHMKKVFWNIATGSTIKNLGLESIKKLKILEPNNNLIEKFDKLTKPIENKRINIFKQNQKLSELRNWLLPMLMNGQVTVANTSLRGTKQSYSETSQNTLGCVAEENEEYR